MKAYYEREQMGLSVTTNAAGERQALGPYLTSWLETTKPVLEEGTWLQRRWLVEQHIVPALGAVRLSQLTAQQVHTLYMSKLGEGLSSTSIHHLHATLHRALEQAMRLGLVMRNVTDLVDAPRMAGIELHPLSPEEARAFLDVASSERLEALYVMALATGMRQSELLGLRWADLDLDLDALPVPVARVQVHLKREGGKFVFKAPKTRRSRQQIALAAPAVAAL
jgi:integrase